ncbi:MAG: hypothetical protein U0694_26815 [Anaerolineae bacterium]
MAQPKKSWKLHVAALIFYVGMAFLLLYALIFHNGTHVAGYDFFNYNWNFWWIRHALTTPGLNVYENNFVMFPAMSNYGYHALTAFWFPLWALLEPLVGTLTAVNVIIFVGCVLNGYLLFVLARREGLAAGLALLAGAALQTLPITRYFYYNTHLNLMDWFWIPAQLLLWKQIVGAKSLRAAVVWALVMGLSLWGLLLTDLQFPIFVAFAIVPYGLWTLWRSPRRMQLIVGGVVALAVGAALMWFAGPIPYILRWQGALIPSPVEERPGVPLWGFLSMAAAWWNWDSPSLGAFVTLALTSVVAVRFIKPASRQPREGAAVAPTWLWLLILLPPMLLMLGPTLTIGDAAIPLPFRWMYSLTNGNFRMPWRLAPVFVIGAMLLVGGLWTRRVGLQRKVNARYIGALAGAFLLLAFSVRLYETAPLQPAPYLYDFYQQMGREPYDDYVVLEVPTGAGTGEVLLGNVQAIQFQYYGILHHQRMINGFISRAPIDSFYYLVSGDPLLSWLGQRRMLEPDAVEAELRDHIFNYPIGYIVIHQDYIGRSTSTIQEIVGYLNTLPDLLCPFVVEGEAIVYRTAWHPDGCADRTPPHNADGSYQVDIGTPGDEFYIGWGWHYQEQVAGLTLRWTGEYPQAALYVNLPPQDYTMTFTAQAFAETRRVQVEVNGTPLGEPLDITADALHEYSISIPAALLHAGQQISISLVYDRAITPAEVGQGSDPRRLAIAVDWIRFTAAN